MVLQSQGFSVYYRSKAMGNGILEDGLEEVMRREQRFDDAYS